MFLGIFENWNDVESEFQVKLEKETMTPLFVCYDLDGYEGNADVYYIQNGKIWEVHGSHCSCFGLEEQWDPEEVHVGQLKRIVENASYGTLASNKEAFKERIKALDGLNLLELPAKEAQMLLALVYS